MAGFVDAVVESFVKTFNLRLFLYFFVVHLIEILVQGFVLLLFFFCSVVVVYVPVSRVGLNNLALLFSNPGLFVPYALAVGVLFLVFVLAMLYLSSVFAGVRFNLFNDFAEGKGLDLGRALADSMPRVFVFFKISLVVLAVIVLFLSVALLPVLGSFFSVVDSPEVGSATGVVFGLILYFFLVFLVFGLAGFLLSPLTALLAPVAFFEKFDLAGSFRRAFSLMRVNYLGNLAFILIYFVILFGINLGVSSLSRFFAFFTLNPAFSSVGSADSFRVFFSSLMLYFFVSLLIFIPYAVWSSVFEVACFRNLFFLDRSLLPSSGSRGRAAVQPRKKTKGF